MKDMKADPRYDIVWLIRRLFRAMGNAVDTHLKEDQLTAAHRAVMEFLFAGELLSVPEIAGKYQVSRQHVQTTVNELLARDLIKAVPNPNHKRSRLMRLSELGRATFIEIRRNEAAIIEKVFAVLDETQIDVTRRSLLALLGRIEKGNLS